MASHSCFPSPKPLCWTFHPETKHFCSPHPPRSFGPSAPTPPRSSGLGLPPPAVSVWKPAIEAAIGAAEKQRRLSMATIGTFTKSGDRYQGAVRTLTLNVKAQIAPAEKENDKAPGYRVFAGQ